MQKPEVVIPVRNYDLAATLTSGQAFRWKFVDGRWEGVIGRHWVRLHQSSCGIVAEVAEPVADWDWLSSYLQLHVDVDAIIATFPADKAMQAAVTSCRGLRLLRQDPWECLASFICSSTKQIVQIEQIIGLLCDRFGTPLAVPSGHRPQWSFPSAETLAGASEKDLRGCKMGFRAPNLLKTAQQIASATMDLQALRSLTIDEARAALITLPGVGRKIADCVLLFAYGFDQAFPVDVWITKALRQLYFPRRRPNAKRLLKFSQTHFGPHAGYAQQYLFHYMRVASRLRRA